MGRKLIALLAAVSLATAACGGGDDDKVQGSSDTTAAETTTTTEPGKGGGPAAGGPGADGAAGPAGGGPSSGSSPATTAPGAATPTTVKPTATTRTAAPGSYTYRRTGSSSGLGGNGSLEGEGTLTVDRPNGNEQHYATHYTESSIEQTLRHRPGGIDLVFLKFTNGGVAYEFRPAQPVLFAPDPPTVGATWSWRITSSDGTLHVDASFKVLRNETVTIGGEAVPTAVVDGDLRFSGAFTGTSKQTVWGSDRYRLVVRIDENTDLGFAKRQASSVLVSTKPS